MFQIITGILEGTLQCKTHQVLQIGLTNSEHHSTDYHTIVHERTSGELTVEIIRQLLTDFGKIKPEDAGCHSGP